MRIEKSPYLAWVRGVPSHPYLVFAPFEFTVTVLVAVLLYLGGALYFAGCIYVTAVGGLFKRAASLFTTRFRIGRVSSVADGEMARLSLAEIAAARHGQDRSSSHSWLN